MEVNQLEVLIGEWIQEIGVNLEEEKEEEDQDIGWDDVKGGELPIELIRGGRYEEVSYMENKPIWEVRSVKECWEVIGKAQISVRWVETDKGVWVEDKWEPLVRCRLVARDFKGKDKDRDDLFAEAPPLECTRMILSRAATRRWDCMWGDILS